VKLSAFYSQIHVTDPETAVAKLSERLRPVLRRAKELGACICVDMESYAMKNLTLRLFKTIFAEPEFADGPQCGIAMQAYLKDGEADLRELINWARAQRKRVTVRLVKGAYWDYESVVARQKGWPVPVWETKPESDACYERCTTLLLENNDAVGAAFASRTSSSRRSGSASTHARSSSRCSTAWPTPSAPRCSASASACASIARSANCPLAWPTSCAACWRTRATKVSSRRNLPKVPPATRSCATETTSSPSVVGQASSLSLVGQASRLRVVGQASRLPVVARASRLQTPGPGKMPVQPRQARRLPH